MIVSCNHKAITKPKSAFGGVITTNADGSFQSEVRYTAFGETRYTSAASTPSDRLYTGQRLEEELGLYYYGARFYDAALAHFVQADTVIPNKSFLLSFIRYAYVYFNPVRLTDPTGHYGWEGGDENYGDDGNGGFGIYNKGTGKNHRNDGDTISDEDKHIQHLLSLLSDQRYASAYFRSGCTTLKEFAVLIIHHEFYELPGNVSQSDLNLIRQTAMNGFRSWLTLGDSYGNKYIDLLNSISKFESPLGAIKVINSGGEYDIFRNGEYEFATRVVYSMVSLGNMLRPDVMCEDYTYWGNIDWMKNTKWPGQEIDSTKIKTFRGGNSFVIITLAEQKRLDEHDTDTVCNIPKK